MFFLCVIKKPIIDYHSPRQNHKRNNKSWHCDTKNHLTGIQSLFSFLLECTGRCFLKWHGSKCLFFFEIVFLWLFFTKRRRHHCIFISPFPTDHLKLSRDKNPVLFIIFCFLPDSKNLFLVDRRVLFDEKFLLFTII